MSQERETTDENMSKVLETLNLHRLMPVTVTDMKNSIDSLTDKVIRGFPDPVGPATGPIASATVAPIVAANMETAGDSSSLAVSNLRTT